MIGCAWIGGDFAVPLGDIPQNQELRLNRELLSGIKKSSLLSGFHPDFLARVIETYQAEITGGLLGDCVVCGLKGLIPGLASAEGAIHYEGSTAVIFHLGTYPADEATRVRND